MSGYRDAAKEDWRLQAAANVLKAPKHGPGSSSRPGDVIKAIANVSFNAQSLVLGLPNPTALLLSASNKGYEQAKTLLMRAVVAGSSQPGKYVPDDLSLEFFEQIMASVVFGYTALEAFANEAIPEGFYYERKYKQFWLAIGKSSIERNISLEMKLKIILPKVMKVSPIGGNQLWQEFLTLQETRDRIIHMKTYDRVALAGSTESIWHNLFVPELICPPFTARRVMAHYLEQSKQKPRWYGLVPF